MNSNPIPKNERTDNFNDHIHNPDFIGFLPNRKVRRYAEKHKCSYEQAKKELYNIKEEEHHL